MRRFLIPVLLTVSGALLIYIAIALLFLPAAFYESHGVTLSQDPGLMSEVRAPGGMLLIAGFIIGWGSFRHCMARLSRRISAIVYGGYGVSRLISLALDGAPSQALMTAMVIELVLAGLALMALRQPRSRWAVSCVARS